jgi:lipopolysaccharide transport system ATP-binding protein
MRKAEIARKFDEIVAFSEIEKFLDTPVKRYSSGMYVRLAFAVAAHLEPEILLVDEVLAVGDTAFQKKCMGKMGSVAKEGRTVLLVSHNLGAIKRLCQRTILLASGELAADGDSSIVVDRYLSGGIQGMESVQESLKRLPPNPFIKLYNINIKQNGAESFRFLSNKNIEIYFDYKVYQTCKKLFLNFELWDVEGNRLVETFHNGNDPNAVVFPGSYISCATIPANFLVPMTYELKIGIGIFGDRDFTKEPLTIPFDVFSEGINNMVYGLRPISGKIALPIIWDTRSI